MSAALDAVVALLDVERLEVDLFRGRQPDEDRPRTFGGLVAGQALVAAARTVVPERAVHSLHAYFLRPGDIRIPILYTVDRIRDGRSFTTRRVVAVQHGKAIFNLQASFQVEEAGLEHQEPAPVVPGPQELPRLEERLAAVTGEVPEWFHRPRPFDMRYVDDLPLVASRQGVRTDRTAVWMRADGTLPDDPVLHVCLVAYASDLTLLETTVRVHGESWGSGALMGASLDHAMWFHRPFRADEWWLYDQRAPWTGHARGLARGAIWTGDGRRVAAVVQEGLLRPLR